MENRISIPKPCHENWDNMLPEEQGRHCLSCCKTVVDFSSWDNESILAYLQNRSEERVCGRFNTTQVAAPAPMEQEVWLRQISRSRMPLFRKIAAVIVLCFGLLYAGDSQAQKRMGKIALPPKDRVEHTKGEVSIQQPDTSKQQPQPATDTLRPQPQIMGMVAPHHPPKEKPIKKVKPAAIAPKTK